MYGTTPLFLVAMGFRAWLATDSSRKHTMSSQTPTIAVTTVGVCLKYHHINQTATSSLGLYRSGLMPDPLYPKTQLKKEFAVFHEKPKRGRSHQWYTRQKSALGYRTSFLSVAQYPCPTASARYSKE